MTEVSVAVVQQSEQRNGTSSKVDGQSFNSGNEGCTLKKFAGVCRVFRDP